MLEHEMRNPVIRGRRVVNECIFIIHGQYSLSDRSINLQTGESQSG